MKPGGGNKKTKKICIIDCPSVCRDMIIPAHTPDPALRAEPGCKKRSSYFITICTHERQCIFGEIVDHEMRLNEAGKIAEEIWFKTAQLRQYVE